MPSTLARACSVFGCGETTPCPTHRRMVDVRSAYARGYDKAWQRRSKAFLRRHPRCGDRPHRLPAVMSECRNEGRIVGATAVDHVIPHRGNRALFWDEDNNWQALCAQCHGRKSKTEQR